ncbi:MAG TPA: tetratricopeptide repeat protein [Thermoanaerobaculia bacterium]|nr:tetratricopeptide repeat protein [Thermoanaerobaculia bacterium]
MRGRRLAAVALALVAMTAARSARAQQAAPRDIWPQATAAAREGEFDTASKKTTELLNTGRTYGIRVYPTYAAGAAAMAGEAKGKNADLAAWAEKAAHSLDGRSPAVAFNEADRAARTKGYGSAIPLALQGFARAAGNYRSNTLSRADLLIVGAGAVAITAILLALALFIRYGRSMAHDFRERLSARFTGGSVSVLAFALLFLPLFLWLGPAWLLFYWLAIFFGYAGWAERVAILVVLILAALIPLALDIAAHWIAGVDSPVVAAAVANADDAYEPDALRRLQDLVAVVPDDPTLHVLIGNLQALEGMDDQARIHYQRAIQLRPTYAGAHVNLGNLLYLNNEFQAAMTEYETAEGADAKLPTAFYNHSVAAGDTYKFDLQKEMIARTRKIDAAFADRMGRNPPPQKIVMYKPAISEAWTISDRLASRPAARALFGNYSVFDPMRSATSPITIGALASLLLALLLFAVRRRGSYANACIKCGRTFCHRCKSARESTTYCTQCIHIYLKRDGVSLDTKRQKLEEVGSHHTAVTRRNRIFATFLPGSAQLMEGRTVAGILGVFFFAFFVVTAILAGRLGPALGPVADVAQMIVRVGAIVIAVILWFVLSLPVYRRRATA